MIVWGNHSTTQFPDPLHCEIDAQVIEPDHDWVEQEFIPAVQQRGAQVIETCGASSAGSAANAIVDHVRDWILGTAEDDWVSMRVIFGGHYGIEPDIIYSFPVTTKNGEWRIVPDLAINDFEARMMSKTQTELLEERDAVQHLL